MALNDPTRLKAWQEAKKHFWIAIALAMLATITFMISMFEKDFLREMDALADSGVSRMHWSVREAEIELFVLLNAIHAAEAHESENNSLQLLEVRTRFDVFFSRVNTLLVGKQLEEFRKNPELDGKLRLLGATMEKYVPVIDGPNEGLEAALPKLYQELSQLRTTVRSAAFEGLHLFGKSADYRRQSLRAVLVNSSYLVMGLFLVLLSSIGILVFMFRRSKATEGAVRETRNRLQEVISTSFDAFLVTSIEGRVTEYNEAAERIFGYSRGEALGRDLVELIVPEQLKTTHVLTKSRNLESKESPKLEKGLIRQVAQRKNGTVFPIELSLSSTIQDGKVVVISYLRDISDRVAAEEELIRARDRAVRGERAKADLLAVMSHEMRTPLNGIMGTIELMKESRLTRRQLEYVSALDTSAGLLLHQVNGVLNMSRAEAGNLDLEVTEVKPSILVKELVESQRHTIEANGNQILFDTSVAPETIWVDVTRLRQVILNLVGNANKFTRNGEIRLECDVVPGAQQVEFRVTDTGIGIAEEERDSVFEEFRTLDSSYSRQAEGTGLGLAISRRFVVAMGGEIGVDSEPGEGSIFWFRLPVGKPPKLEQETKKIARKRQTAAFQEQSGSPLEILLVEDNLINRLVARDMLKNLKHKVSEAKDGWEGVHLANKQKFDLILMDISMPELDGVAATTLIRGAIGPNQRTPIIALTAHALPEDAARFQAAGINSTLIKPLSFATLNAGLAGIMTRPAEPSIERTDLQIATIHAELVEQLGPEQAFAFFDAFRSEAESLVERVLAPGWENVPLSVRAAEVHKLSGSAAVLGASELQACLKELEGDYRRGQGEAARQRLPALKNSWGWTLDQLNVYLKRPSET